MAPGFTDGGSASFLPELDIDACTAALEGQVGTDGPPPQGIQGWAVVRDGDSLELGLPRQVADQPGVLEGSEVHWAYDEGRQCLTFGTTKIGVLTALRTDVPGGINTRDPTAHDQYILASSTLSTDTTGRLRTTIPARAQPDHNPFDQLGVDVPQQLLADGPPIPRLDPGMVFAVVAEHVPAAQGRDTAVALQSIIDYAVALTPQRLRGENSRYPWATPVLTSQWKQASLLTGVPIIDRGPDDRLYVVGGDSNHPIRKRIEILQDGGGVCSLTQGTIERVCHGRELTPEELQAVLRRLMQVGGLALALPP